MKKDIFPADQINEKDYNAWAKEIGDRFRKSQVRAVAKVNEESLRFNWSVGRDIVLKDFTNTYGSGFFAKFSKDMKKQFPEIKSFSVTNLHYMKWYYELYSGEDNLTQPGVDSVELVFHIPWGPNKLIIDKCKNDQEKALFYVRKTIENNWAKRTEESTNE